MPTPILTTALYLSFSVASALPVQESMSYATGLNPLNQDDGGTTITNNGTIIGGQGVGNVIGDITTGDITTGDVAVQNQYPLHDLAKYGTAEEIRRALKRNRSQLDARDEDGRTPLMYAAWLNENPGATKELLWNNADPNASDSEGLTPFLLASYGNGNPEVIRILLRSGAQWNSRALKFATEHNNQSVVQALKELDPTTYLFYLLWRPESPSRAELERALDHEGLNINERSPQGHMTPLHLAAITEDEWVITALINAGALINTKSYRHGQTPLMWAASDNPNPEVISVLINDGADLDATNDYSETALILAMQYNENPEISRMLATRSEETGDVRDNNITASGPSIEEWYERHHRSVPILSHIVEERLDLGMCSAFIIKHDSRLFLITNRHCIDSDDEIISAIYALHFSTDPDSGSILANTYSYESAFPTEMFHVHPDGCDVAICDVTQYADVFAANGIYPLELAIPDDIPKASALFWIGHPASGSRAKPEDDEFKALQTENDLSKVTTGTVASLKREHLGYGHDHWPGAETYQIITTGTINSGNSGGPMMRLSDGKVVGICSAGNKTYVDQEGIVRGVKNRNMAVRSRHIIETINKGVRWDPEMMGSGSGGSPPPRAQEQNNQEINLDFLSEACMSRWPRDHHWLAEVENRIRWMQKTQDADFLYCDITRSGVHSLDEALENNGCSTEKVDQIYVLAIPYEGTADIDLQLVDGNADPVKQKKIHGYIDGIEETSRLSDKTSNRFGHVWGLRKGTTSHVRHVLITNSTSESEVLLLIFGRQFPRK